MKYTPAGVDAFPPGFKDRDGDGYRERFSIGLLTASGSLGLLFVFFVFGTFDPNFRLIVTKPDNVPITIMVMIAAGR